MKNKPLSGRETLFILIIVVLVGIIVYMWLGQGGQNGPVGSQGAPAQPKAFTLTSPTLGQKVCFNGTLTISWQAPASDTGEFEMTLHSGNTNYPIASGILVNPVDGNGGSPYVFHLSGRYPAGYNYMIQAGGEGVNATSPYFSIVHCDASGNPIPLTSP